jgi:hypothetical protein
VGTGDEAPIRRTEINPPLDEPLGYWEAVRKIDPAWTDEHTDADLELMADHVAVLAADYLLAGRDVPADLRALLDDIADAQVGRHNKP